MLERMRLEIRGKENPTSFPEPAGLLISTKTRRYLIKWAYVIAYACVEPLNPPNKINFAEAASFLFFSTLLISHWLRLFWESIRKNMFHNEFFLVELSCTLKSFTKRIIECPLVSVNKIISHLFHGCPAHNYSIIRDFLGVCCFQHFSHENVNQLFFFLLFFSNSCLTSVLQVSGKL